MNGTHSRVAALAVMLFTGNSLRANLFISEYLANPTGTDGPFEYVELLATANIDFAVTPYSVVFANNGVANANGWTAGGNLTYGFNINAGKVSRGDLVYVGGSSMAPLGTKLRTLNTTTTGGDGIGFANFNASGVLGNGGDHADGIAVFTMGTGLLTPVTVPFDAVFFGETAGNAVVSGGNGGYQLPINDLYSGGKLKDNSFLALDPAAGQFTVAKGSYNPVTGTWVEPRTFYIGGAAWDGTAITVVPEPAGMLKWAGLGFLFWRILRWRRSAGK